MCLLWTTLICIYRGLNRNLKSMLACLFPAYWFCLLLKNKKIIAIRLGKVDILSLSIVVNKHSLIDTKSWHLDKSMALKEGSIILFIVLNLETRCDMKMKNTKIPQVRMPDPEVVLFSPSAHAQIHTTPFLPRSVSTAKSVKTNIKN